MMHALTLGTSALLNGSSSRALLSLDFTTAAISSITSYPGWTFSGGTTTNGANRYAEDASGNLVAFASGLPRITNKGFLIEEARTNLVLQSNDLSSAAWTKANTTAALVAGAPDGGLASRLSATAAFATAFGGLISVSASTTYAVSAYAKNVNATDVSLVFEAADHGGSSATISYNFANKTVSGANSGFSVLSRTAVEIGSGWTRLTIVLTTPAGLTTLRPKLWIGLYSGTNYSGQAIDWWCIQMEPGSFPTSPIVTTGAAATRAADNASVTGLAAMLGQFRTNWIPNSSMVGAGVGALPSAGWSTSSGSGVAGSIVGFGSTAEGLPYIDVRVQGTPIATTNFGIYTSAGNVVPAASGQTWTASVYSAIVAGAAPAGTKYGVWESDSSGNYLAEASVNVPASALTRYAATRVFNQAGTAYARTVFVAPVTSGVPVDFTIRIAAPQLERNASATEWIPTTTAAASAGNPVTLVAWVDLPAADGVNRDVGGSSNASGTEAIRFRRGAGNDTLITVVAGGVSQNVTPVGGFSGARTLLFANRLRGGSARLALNGSLRADTPVTTPGPMDRLALGVQIGSSSYLNGYIQRVAIYGDVDDNRLISLTT